MTPEDKAHELMTLAIALIQVMATEIELLKVRKLSGLAETQAQKSALSDLYHGHMTEIAANPGIFDGVDSKIRDELKRLAAQLDATAKENANRVRSALELNTKLVERIALAAQQNATSAAGYTNTGARSMPKMGRAYAQAPVSLNQQL